MKKIIAIILGLFLFSFYMTGQEETPNPNAQKSHEKYEKQLDSHEQNMGSTIQNTYEARDPWQEKKDARIDRKEDRRDFRRQLRLERARRPILIPQRRRFFNDPWRQPYPYVW
ncbi:MAG TPA: hypothetical protein VJ917_11255 [Saprospiraceae bacterium]|nr:hypothetical protein [Saprospiraceae bacterium]